MSTDRNGNADGTTTFNRVYNDGAPVTLVATGTANGNPFIKWQKDGVDLTPNSSAYVTMSADHTMTAVYGQAGTTRTFTSLIINGPPSIPENTSQPYTATAYFSDGSSMAVTPLAWSVNPSGYASISNSGVLDAGAVTSDTTIHVITSYLFGNVTQLASTLVTITHTNTNQTYTLTLHSSDNNAGGVIPSPFGVNSYPAGSTVRLTPYANYGYHFTSWSGDASGASNPFDMAMNSNKSVTANFVLGDDRLGTLVVTIQPPEAAAAGVQWGWNENDYRDSGASTTGFPGSYFFALHLVDGWLPPNDFQISGVHYFGPVSLTAGTTTYKTVTFTKDTTPGTLSVTLTPPNAVTAGAQYHINGGAAQSSGVNLSLQPGTYTLTYNSAPGWTAPSSETVEIKRSQTTVINSNYTPPVDQPVITAIHPNFGSLAGNTTLTIDGLNLSNTVIVLVGGKPATNITVVNATQITCLTPSSTVYGTQAITVQTTSGSATNLNGFAYATPLGNGVALLTSFGGYANAVAVQGNYAYVSEGSSFLVVNVSNPSSSSVVGRLAMPGMIQDIALSGQYAFVANAVAGLQVVDISNPAAPALKGFYTTTGRASGLSILGSKAYVADGAGLEVLDLANPLYPAFLSSTNYNGAGNDVALSSTANKTTVYLASSGIVSVIDASDSSNLVLHGHVDLGDYVSSIAVSGTSVFAAMPFESLHQIDVSNPDAPVDRGVASIGYVDSVATANNLVYTAGTCFSILNYGNGSPSVVGKNTGIASYGYNSSISGSRDYLADATGLQIVDISNSASPLKLCAFSDSGIYGDYYSAALSGNYLFTVGGGGLKVFDVSNPAQPHIVSQNSSVGGSQGQILVKNGIAYVLGSGGTNRVQILNVSNPVSPSIVGGIPITTIYPQRIALSGNNLLVAGFNNSSNQARFLIADVSNPSTPVVHGVMDIPSTFIAISVATVGNKAIITTGDHHLRILDISNINAPVQQGEITDVGVAYDVQMSADGHYAFVADVSNNVLRVIDVSNPGIPVQVGSAPVAGAPWRINVQGSIVYVSASAPSMGIYGFDVSNPAAPTVIQSYQTPGQPYDVAFATGFLSQQGTMFVSDSTGGIIVLQTKDNTAPVISITNPTVLSTYPTATGALTLGGSASDNIGLTSITWSNNRGGGGSLSGTSSWSVSGVLLASGTNIITVNALDSAGNVGTATLTAIYTPADTTPPVVNIISPTTTGTTTTPSGTITVQGLASDNVAVAQVQWANDRGGSGTASGTTNWTASGIPLQPGPNAISITASDSSNNTAVASIVVTYIPPDTTPPSVTIQFPTLEPVFNTNLSTLNISGIASDDQSVAKVTWSNDQGGSGTAAGIEVWNANGIVLKPGLNLITVTAQDPSGNTGTDSVAVTYTPLPVPQITSASGAAATTGQYFSYLITSSNTPYSFDASGLPAGLSVNNTTGVIAGTPTQTGVFTPSISAINTGGTGSATLTITVLPPSPVITPVLGTQEIVAGQPATFSVSAAGTGSLTYQWYENGDAISGATSSSYTIPDATTGNAGNYTVTVTDSNGLSTSSTYTLTVDTPIPSMPLWAHLTLALLLVVGAAPHLLAKRIRG